MPQSQGDLIPGGPDWSDGPPANALTAATLNAWLKGAVASPNLIALKPELTTPGPTDIALVVSGGALYFVRLGNMPPGKPTGAAAALIISPTKPVDPGQLDGLHVWLKVGPNGGLRLFNANSGQTTTASDGTTVQGSWQRVDGTPVGAIAQIPTTIAQSSSFDGSGAGSGAYNGWAVANGGTQNGFATVNLGTATVNGVSLTYIQFVGANFT